MQLIAEATNARASRRRARMVAGAALAAACILGAAPGYSKTMQQKMEATCAADVAKLCSQVGDDHDRIKACMVEHRREASRACMDLMDASD